MDLKDIRFKQRLINLKESHQFLLETIDGDANDRILNAAIIKAFEMCFELCWKTLKDLLEFKGITVNSPRDTLKESFQMGYLKDGQIWIDLLDQRNQWVHVYHKEQAAHAKEFIVEKALPHINALITLLDQQ